MSNINKDGVWFEKYRPTTLKSADPTKPIRNTDACYPQRINEKFKDGIYGNLMFIGSAGNGKSTLGRILAKGYSVLAIDGSIENGVDVVREKITQFCSMSGFDTKRKIVFIDEADHLSQQAQAGLRGTIEKFHKVAYFIFTLNYPEKILEPIRSRFEQVNLNLTDPLEIEEQSNNYIRRIAGVCKAEDLAVTREGIMEIMKRYYPDFRSIFNTMQGIKRAGGALDAKSLAITSMGDVDVEFYQTIKNTSIPTELYKYVKAKFMNKEHKAYDALSTSFLEWLMSDEVNKSIKVGEAAACVHKYQYESQGVIDKLVSLCACCFELNRIIR